MAVVEDVVGGVEGGEDGRHRRLADLAAVAGAEAADEPGEVADPGRGRALEELLSGLPEVGAQGLVLLHTLGVQQLAEQSDTGPAARARPGAGLQVGDRARAVGDRLADVTLGHGIAGADLGGVRQSTDADCRGVPAGRGEEGHRVRQVLTDHRTQHRVRLGVTDEDATEKCRAGPVHHELAVGAVDRVIDGQRTRAVGGGVGVTEAGDIHPEQLQLRGHVRVLEGGGGASRDPVGDDLRGGVAGGDEAVADPVDRGALADGADVRVCRLAQTVGEDAAAWCLGQRFRGGVVRESVDRADAGGEDDDIDVQFGDGRVLRCRLTGSGDGGGEGEREVVPLR